MSSAGSHRRSRASLVLRISSGVLVLATAVIAILPLASAQSASERLASAEISSAKAQDELELLRAAEVSAEASLKFARDKQDDVEYAATMARAGNVMVALGLGSADATDASIDAALTAAILDRIGKAGLHAAAAADVVDAERALTIEENALAKAAAANDAANKAVLVSAIVAGSLAILAIALFSASFVRPRKQVEVSPGI